MLLEPPGPDLPPRHGLSPPPLDGPIRGRASVGSPVGWDRPADRPRMPARRSPQRSSTRTTARTTAPAAHTRPTTPVPRPKRPRPGSDRSVLWRWRRGLFMVGLMVVATTGGVAAVVFNIELPPEESLLQTSFVCAADVTEGCGPDNAIATLQRRGGPHQRAARRGPGRAPAGGARRRGPGLLRARRHRPGRHRPGALQRPPGHRRHAGRLHHHPAVRQERLPHLRAQHRPQGEGGGAGGEARAGARARTRSSSATSTPSTSAGAPTAWTPPPAPYFGKDVEDIGLARGRPTWPGSSGRREAPMPSSTRRRPPVVGAPCSTAMAAGGLHHRRGARRRRRHADPDRAWWSRATGRASAGWRATRRTTTSAPSTSWRPCGGRSPSEYGEDVLYGGGLRIYTTLDFDLQRAAWDAVTSTLDQPTDPDAALVAVDEYGYVKAMVGGRDFETDEVNLALGAEAGGSGRGAGSSFKPFVLAEAIRQGISLNSMFDAPALDHVPRRARREARRAVEGEQLRRHRAGRARPRRRHPRVLQHRLRAAHARGRARQRGHARQPPRRVGRAAGRAVAGARQRGRLPARHGRGLQHLRQPRRAQRPDPHRQDRAGRRGRRRRGDRPGRAHRRAGAHRGAGRPRHLLPPGGREGRHRRVGGVRQAGRRQDRHHPGQQGRLVRRLHARSSPPRCGSATPTRCPTAPSPRWTRTRR